MKRKVQSTAAILNPGQPPKILTVAQVADLLQVPKSSVYERTRRRRSSVPSLPSRKIGKYLRFFEAEVLEWLASLPTNRNAAR